jgi:hypothetical protein
MLMTATLYSATNAESGVVRSDSSIMKGGHVYSVRYPGGAASELFKFLGTNGFAADNVLFAARAGEVWIPAFTVNNVRLKELAKSIEFLTEGKLSVEAVERGPESDVNIWRIKLSDSGAVTRTRACAVPQLLAKKVRIQSIVDEVRQLLQAEGVSSPGAIKVLEEEKIVVAVGGAAYVEAVSSALEAAELVAEKYPGAVGDQSKPGGQ